MTNRTATAAVPPARTHAEASALLRRPFAPGAIGFRAMTKVPLNGQQYGGAQVAAYLNAQSVVQRLNAVVPGRWQQQFAPVPPELQPDGAKKLYLACRLEITLPLEEGGEPVPAVYEDVGELDQGSRAGLKALYSDARKRAAVVAGIGAYLYTALTRVVLPIGNGACQVRAVRRPGKGDLLELTPETEQWLREGYRSRMASDATRRDLGEMLAHGEPENGMGQGEEAEHAAPPGDDQPAASPTAELAAAPDAHPRPTRHGQGEGGKRHEATESVVDDSPARELAYWQQKGRYGDELTASLAALVSGERAIEAHSPDQLGEVCFLLECAVRGRVSRRTLEAWTAQLAAREDRPSAAAALRERLVLSVNEVELAGRREAA